MQTEKLLENLGLKENMARIYLAILELKKATVLQVAKQTGILRTAIYNSLRTLENKGLISQIIDKGKKFWIIESPANLSNLVKLKQKALDELMPMVTQIFNTDKYQPKIKFYEGKEGVKKLCDESLNNHEKLMRAMGDYHTLKNMVGIKYNKSYWDKRVRNEINVRLIDSIKNKKFYQADKNFNPISNIKKMRELRLAPPSLDFTLYIMTFDDKVLFFSPPEEGYSFMFQSPAFAKTVKSLFVFLWQLSEPLR